MYNSLSIFYRGGQNKRDAFEMMVEASSSVGSRLTGAAVTSITANNETVMNEDNSMAMIDPDKRRKITIKCLELEEMLETQG